MNKIRFFSLYLLLSLSGFSAYAADAKLEDVTNQAKLRDPVEFEKVISEYKEYVAKIPVQTREEIINYRKEVAKINIQKKQLYKKLSQESQNYLKKESQYKRKLPHDRKKLISIDPESSESETKEIEKK